MRPTCVYDLGFVMQEVQSTQYITEALPDEVCRKYFIWKKVLKLPVIHSQCFVDETCVLAMRSADLEGVEKSSDMAPPAVLGLKAVDMLIGAEFAVGSVAVNVHLECHIFLISL